MSDLAALCAMAAMAALDAMLMLVWECKRVDGGKVCGLCSCSNNGSLESV